MDTSDRTLIQRWQREGDSEAFAELVRRHAVMVFGAANRILRNADDAEDIAQESFAKISQIRRLRGDSVGGLLHTIATHLAINRLNAAARRRAREIEYATLNESTAKSDWPSVAPHIDEAIASLSSAQREAVIHHFLEGESYRAIARARHVDESTVRHHAQRGLERIRRFLRRRGVTSATATLVASLSAQTEAAALPATLVSALGKQAVAGPATAAGLNAASTLGIGGSAIVMKKTAVLIGTAIVLAAGVAGLRVAFREPAESEPFATADQRESNAAPHRRELSSVRPQADAAATSSAADTPDARTDEASVEAPGTDANREAETAFAVLLADAFERAAERERGVDVAATPIGSAEVPEDNGMHYFLKAWELFEGELDTDMEVWEDMYRRLEAGQSLTDDEWAKYTEMQEALDLIRYGIEVGNVAMPIGKEGPETPLPFLAVWRHMARIMNLDDYQTIIAFGGDMGRGGPLINGLVGAAVTHIGTEPLMTFLSRGELTADEYRAVIVSLQDVQANALPHWETLLYEQAYTVEWFESVGSTADALRSFLSSGAEDSASSEMMFAALQAIPDDNLLRYFNQYREDYERLVQYSTLPYYEAMPLLEDAEAFTPNVISNMILPAMGQSLAAYTIRDARLQGAMTIAAVEAYRLDTGAYPNTLNALVPEYLAGPAVDPFTGDTLRYQPRTSGYRLYSTGMDMTDNGGLVDDYKKPGTDLVFHK